MCAVNCWELPRRFWDYTASFRGGTLMNRRTFLGTMTAATVLARNFSWAAAEHKIEKVGIQLYTVRDLLKQDFDGTLAKIAAIGYREVESGSSVEKSAQEQKEALAHYGLTA